MEVITRISSSISEPWVAWTMLILLVLLVLADVLQRGVVIDCFKSLWVNKERGNLFATTQFNLIGRIALYIFKINILSLALFSQITMTYSFVSYLIFLGIVVGVLLLKILINRLLAYVFFNMKTYEIAYYQYAQLTTCCAVVLYPMLLLIFFVPQIGQITSLILLAAVLLFYVIILIIKIFQLFFTKPMAGAHILVYLCTLEVLPFMGMLLLGKALVK